MVFFFFFDHENLKSELKDFVVDPKLAKAAERALRQRNDFISRYPLVRLERLSSGELWSAEQCDDDFVHWVTDKTRDVTNSLPWVKYNLGLRSNRFIANEARGKRKYFIDSGRDELLSFLRSKGLESSLRLEHSFGRPLLLKLLYLYYPTQFCNIASVDWIEKITSTFALSYGRNVYERSRGIRHFVSENSYESDGDGIDLLKDFLIEYLGLRNETKPFFSYLTQVSGLSSDAANRYGLLLRQLSRMLFGFGVTRKPLFKLPPEELLGIKGMLIDGLNTHITTDARKKIRKKLDDFAEALSRYVAYIGKLALRQRRAVLPAAQPFTVAGKSHEVYGCGERYDATKPIDWSAELLRAKNAEQVVEVLQRSGASRPYYRHYTTLSSFLCIADDWMFRLTRGDDPKMNDQLEWKRLGDEKLWKRTFIGSFSCVEGESAAMWGLYGKPSNEALRLSMDSSAMRQWISSLNKATRAVPRVQFFGVNGEVGEKCKLRWKDLQILFGDVLYGGNIGAGEESDTRYIFRNKRLNKTLLAGADETIERAPEMTGFIKSADWAYEEESRLIIRVKEDAHLPSGKKVDDIQYVFLPVPQEVMSKVEYMKGPSVTAKLRPVIEEKLKSLFPTAIVSDSRYKDNLKFK